MGWAWNVSRPPFVHEKSRSPDRSRIFVRRMEPLVHDVCCPTTVNLAEFPPMHEIIYLIGLIVVVMFVLGALGLR